MEDSKYQADAYHFLYSEYGQGLLEFVSAGVAVSKFNERVASILRTADLRTYQVQSYARRHELEEVAKHFDVDIEDMRYYAKRHCIHFMKP